MFDFQRYITIYLFPVLALFALYLPDTQIHFTCIQVEGICAPCRSVRYMTLAMLGVSYIVISSLLYLWFEQVPPWYHLAGFMTLYGWVAYRVSPWFSR